MKTSRATGSQTRLRGSAVPLLTRKDYTFTKHEASALGAVDRRYRDVIVDRKMEEVFQTSDVTPGSNLVFSSCSAPPRTFTLPQTQYEQRPEVAGPT
ncbi:hypothetical protein A4U53_027635 [Rhizobium ruizarguesonis]|uniref:Uncharacterized protein n=2 Tax=Rhizobium TaxID=379 RepID=A0A179BES2_RHILE|nr:hypothetical protein [Rhizobium leguminosarum]OAP90198.1 hypothetical protein A4U53_30750 [Rhizobium leguminosarum]